jgi:hypothetical protein
MGGEASKTDVELLSIVVTTAQTMARFGRHRLLEGLAQHIVAADERIDSAGEGHLGRMFLLFWRGNPGRPGYGNLSGLRRLSRTGSPRGPIRPMVCNR